MDLSSFLTPAAPSAPTPAAAAPPASAPAPVSAPAAAATPASSAPDDEPGVADAAGELNAQANTSERPEKPDGYTLDYSLPAGFKTDVALGKLDPAHPTIAAARQFAHAEGLTQAQFSKMLGLYAQNVAAESAGVQSLDR